MRKLMLGLGFLLSFSLIGLSGYFMFIYEPVKNPVKENQDVTPIVNEQPNNLNADIIKNIAFTMVSSARSVVATKEYKIPYSATPSVTSPNGCYILWNDLAMNDDNLPVGGKVNVEKSGVLITEDETNKVATYTVYLVNETGDTGIPGIIREAITTDTIIINNQPAPMPVKVIDAMDQTTNFAKACSI